jgi:hypothetical protein
MHDQVDCSLQHKQQTHPYQFDRLLLSVVKAQGTESHVSTTVL